MKQLFRGITIDQNVQFGKPVIAGTRVPIAVIVGHVAGGMTVDEVAKEYQLKREDVLTALAYASKVVAEETIMVR